MNNHYDVVIIGAGLSGIGAALTLHQAKSRCIIVEAQNTPGGRINTLKIGNSHIDLGAQWIHGDNTKLYEILQENNLIHPKTSTEGDGIYIRDDGLIIDDFLVRKVDFEVGKILENALKFVHFSTQNFKDLEAQNVGEFLNLEFHKYLKSIQVEEEEKTLMEDVLNWHINFQKIDNSCNNLNNLSLKEWGRYECPTKDGEDEGQQHINIKGGYQSLINALVKKLPPNVIKYNMAVNKIDIHENKKVLLTFEDNSQLSTDTVIITCSLGILKSLLHHKQLVLPLKMSKTIESMGFDSMGKVFLEFDTKWWSSNIQIVWRIQKDSSEDFPHWLRHSTGFEMVLDQDNLLLLWVGHEGVDEMEKTDKFKVGEQCVKLLRFFLKDDSVPLPRNVYKSSWLSNPFIKGGYSYATPFCDDDLPPGKVLAEPVCDANGEVRLLLAGEAVHAECFSTTHGAFESGVMQAEKLLSLSSL